MDKIFINIQEKVNSLNEYYLNCFLDIQEKYWSKIYNFFLWGDEINFLGENTLKEKWIIVLSYKDENDLIEKVRKLRQENTKYFVNTFTEQLIPIANKIKIELSQNVTDDFELFRNKRKQRELLSSNSDIWTKFQKLDYKNTNLEKILLDFSFPFVLKPSNWIQSSWVSVINNSLEFSNYMNDFQNFLNRMSSRVNVADLELIVEEFIDWEKYSIDYFVWEDWEINWITDPIYNISWKDIWIDDLFEFLIFASKNEVKKIDEEKLDLFLKNTIKATWIKNTFVHHEFKLTSKWELKTIELNGRIWWYRLEMYLESSNINLLEFMFEKKWKYKIETDFAVIQFYSERQLILKEFNDELIEKIKKLASFFSINLIKDNIWKQVWLTKDGFWKVAALRLKHSDSSILEQDISFITKNFNNFLILE